MTKPFTTQIVGHDVTQSIYVKADGRTVCSETDKDVASMVFTKGDRITEAQRSALIFPGGNTDEIPDASKRSADVIPDAETRVGKKAK